MYESFGSKKEANAETRPNYEEWTELEIKTPVISFRSRVPKKYTPWAAISISVAVVPILASLNAPWYMFLVVAIIGILPFIVDRMKDAKTQKKDSKDSVESGDNSKREGKAGPSD